MRGHRSKCELCTDSGAKLFETNPDAREVREPAAPRLHGPTSNPAC